MPYLGTVELKASDIRRIDITSSTSATHTLTWTAPNEQSLIVTINGVKQQNNYTVSGTTLTLDTALSASDLLEVIGINDIGTTITPAQGSVNTDQLANDAVTSAKIAAGTIDTADIADDAVTADKLANSINTEIAANTAKVTNATHTGDVTGATALTIATDAVDIAMLSATGTADSTTFLRGDNAWAGGGKVLQVVQATKTDTFTTTSTSYVDVTGLTASITPASASNKILVVVHAYVSNTSTSNGNAYLTLVRDSTEIFIGDTAGSRSRATTSIGPSRSHTGYQFSASISYLDSPSATTSTTYKLQAQANGSGTFVLGRSGDDSNDANEGRTPSSIILMEIAG